MIIKGKDLIIGIRKAKGVVDESSVIEDLRGFRFNPRENGIVDIAGSDGRMTLLAQIPYEKTDESDGSQLSLSSDKIQELVKYIDEDSNVSISYTEEDDIVIIEVDKYRLKTRKKEFENEFIKFEILDETDFDDKLSSKKLVSILDSLLPLARVDSPDASHQTIFFDTENAYLFDGNIVGKIKMKTNREYVIDYKSARQIQVLLKSSDSEYCNLKYMEEDYQVLLRTETDILTFRVMDDELVEIDFMDEFEEDLRFTVNRTDLVNSVNKTKLATEEDEVFINILKGKIKLKGMTQDGESATDEVKITDVEGELPKEDEEIDLLAQSLIKLAGVIRTKELLVRLDKEEMYMIIEDTSGKAQTIMTVNIQ